MAYVTDQSKKKESQDRDQIDNSKSYWSDLLDESFESQLSRGNNFIVLQASKHLYHYEKVVAVVF